MKVNERPRWRGAAFCFVVVHVRDWRIRLERTAGQAAQRRDHVAAGRHPGGEEVAGVVLAAQKIDQLEDEVDVEIPLPQIRLPRRAPIAGQPVLIVGIDAVVGVGHHEDGSVAVRQFHEVTVGELSECVRAGAVEAEDHVGKHSFLVARRQPQQPDALGAIRSSEGTLHVGAFEVAPGPAQRPSGTSGSGGFAGFPRAHGNSLAGHFGRWTACRQSEGGEQHGSTSGQARAGTPAGRQRASSRRRECARIADPRKTVEIHIDAPYCRLKRVRASVPRRFRQADMLRRNEPRRRNGL